jgi:DNA-binding NarL/FixJ family response regulator
VGLSSRISISGVDEQGQPTAGHALSNYGERLLFLVAREALYWVRQHSDMHRLRLVLNYGQEEVQMSIEDDGMHAAADATLNRASAEGLAPPFGQSEVEISAVENGQYDVTIINDLRFRLERLGGRLEITTSGERGNRMEVRIPYISSICEDCAVPAPATNAVVLSPQDETKLLSAEFVTVLIVDHQTVTRAGLRYLLEAYADIRIVGEAADSVQAVSEALELGPQVVLLDMQLPGGQSLEALQQMKQLNRDTRVLLLLTQEREEYLYELLRAGAEGYVMKDIAPGELAQAIRTVARGEILVQPQMVSRLLARVGKGHTDALTTRELEVLRLLARGLRNKEIAARLYVSERTVNFHLANIYQKLNVSGRTEALSKALEQGLIKV